MARTDEWSRLARLAASQDGVLSDSDVWAAGVSGAQRRRLVDNQRLERVAPGVLRVIGAPSTHRQELRIGLLSLGPDSWVSYEAAAALHGLDRSDGEAVEFTVPRSNRRPRSGFRVHTSERFDRTDFVMVDGLRAMSATRTVIDLAHSRAAQFRVEAAMDSAVRLGLSHPVAIATRLETLRGSGRWGCRMIDRILPDSGGHSPLERRFLQLVRAAGLPRPRTQVIHRDAAGQHVARVDFEFEEQGVIVEVTGRLGHVSDAERARDAQRRNELQALGRVVIEYTSRQVFDEPQWVANDLRRRLT